MSNLAGFRGFEESRFHRPPVFSKKTRFFAPNISRHFLIPGKECHVIQAFCSQFTRFRAGVWERVRVKRKEPVGRCCPSSTVRLFWILEVNSSSSDTFHTLSEHQHITRSLSRFFGDPEIGGSALTLDPHYKVLPEWLKSYRPPPMSPKLADQVAKKKQNLFGFFIFVGSRLGLRS